MRQARLVSGEVSLPSTTFSHFELLLRRADSMGEGYIAALWIFAKLLIQCREVDLCRDCRDWECL